MLELKDLKFGTDIKSKNLKRSAFVFVKFTKSVFPPDDVIQANLQNAKKKKTFQLEHR